MSRSWPGRAIALAAALAAAAPAQQDAAEVTLHAAWLCEVMDLDVARAVAGYRRLAAEARPGQLERWVAAARLAELRRIGAAPGATPDLGELPPPLRAAFTAVAQPLPASTLLARIHGEPKTVLQALTTEAGRLPTLRSVVPASEDWLMRQIGPSLRDRWRQRMETWSSRGRGAESARTTERIYAADVLRAELQGRTPQADALRALYFADWRPPAAVADAATELARIRHNLAAALGDSDMTAAQSALLRELGAALDQRDADPAAAVALVRRLPLYAERLLQTEPSGGR